MFVVTCWKYKIIAIVVTGVEHFVISTLQYVYAYLYVSWFLFIFKVAVMFINSFLYQLTETEKIALTCWDM